MSLQNQVRRFMPFFFKSSEETCSEEPLLQAEAGWTHAHGSLDETNRSWWSNLTFSWVSPIMEMGAKRQLDFRDLFPLPNDMSADFCCSRLLNNWQVEKRRESVNPSLLRALLSSYGRPWLVVGLVKVVNDGLSFAGPLFLNEIVKFIDSDSKNLSDGYWWACALGAVSVIRAFLGAHYTFLLGRVRLQVKASITTIVYQKALCVSLSERSTFSTGEIQTFMSVDAERIANLVNCGHEIWSLPMQMGIALWMLYLQVKFAFVAGLGVIVLLIPVNKWIANLICAANESMMKEKDERVRRMGELLMYIRTLKMYAWEQFFLQKVMQSREQELKFLAVKKYLDACCVYFWACTPTIFSLLTFGLFVLLGYTLTAATVFTSLALFNILITPLNSFPWVINGVIEAQVSLGRLCKFLSCSEVDSEWTKEILLLTDEIESEDSSKVDPGSTKSPVNDGNVEPGSATVMLENAAFSWSHSAVENPVPIISQISLAIPTGSLVVILGKVGSGKSSLLGAILGEMRCVQGSVLVRGRIAYVPQSPWIQAGTLCDNILLGQPFSAERYKSVVDACALDVDINQMQGGDLAAIGERGVNLSGGQRARLALARALYQDCDTYLFDDPLSAVDAHVAAWLMEHAISGPQMADKTRILCTHHAQAISYADILVTMEDGKVTYCGSPSTSVNNLKQNDVQSFRLDMPTLQLSLDEAPSSASVPWTTPASASVSSLPVDFDELSDRHFMSPTEHVFGSYTTKHIKFSPAPRSVSTKSVKVIEEEGRNQGHVQSTVYRAYGGFVTWSVIAIILVSVSLMQATRNGSDWWLAYWVDSNSRGSDERGLSFYLKVYVGLAIANSIFTLSRSFVFAYGGMRAASEVHSAFLKKKYYRATSRELRRLDGVSRSPIYTTFTEALEGAATIRAFRAQGKFAEINRIKVGLNLRASYSEMSASLWLSIRLQMLAALLVYFVSMVAIFSRQSGSRMTPASAGLVGLGLSYASPIITTLNNLLAQLTETEKDMVSMERILQYMNLDAEPSDGTSDVSADWPTHGEIEFIEVTLVYLPKLPPALRGLSFRIQAGEQVGIAGRTGAGKSSVLGVLFRLNPISSGTIVIDGVNTSSIPLHVLRSRLSVVPQTPMLFEGTLRQNLNPAGDRLDVELWTMLEKCHMKEAVKGAGGLDLHVSECGESLSLGQRQLLCLARAILSCARILCLDECTANIDPDTTCLIMETVAVECKNMTVITIAHRIATILELDRVLIMDLGALVEEGKPQDLLANPNSRFSELVKASGADSE